MITFEVEIALTNCLGLSPDNFSPMRADQGAIDAAKAVCRNCVQTKECLADAIDDVELDFFAHFLGLEAIRAGTTIEDRLVLRAKSADTAPQE